MKIKAAILAAILLSGCSEVSEESFSTQHSAAVAWFKHYHPVAESLTSEQELLGFVLKCPDGRYKYSSYEIGGISNSYHMSDKIGGCDKVAHLHTHPIVAPGLTVDFFSKVDLATSNKHDLYMMAMNKCKIRIATKDNNHNRYGDVIGTSTECLYGKTYRE
ncbi:hypothetical protein PQC39_gp076 [Vibrio phage Vp_R1]|uniref:DUF4329 domain-containing protein n=1 Tax=Vibrio phage Vp_R1 TaxID=2059867 RepID=A0A2H5BQ32_9CAUD|nr:hypothetical protein PQC39_gp076 [Vibrio phage Vp_R1]AUG88440.1 hypothetical protein VPR_076 [Vibrio phage Vp_R1]